MMDGLSEPLRGLHRRHVAAWCDLDLDRLADLYDDAVLVFDTYPPPAHHGWSAFRGRIAPELARFERFELRTFDHAGRRQGAMAWIASRYRIDAVRDGEPYETAGRWTEVYEKRDGEWRLTHLHTSIDPGA